jgi:hypothetical protein
MTHDDPTVLGTALRERVELEDPDLDRLIRVSTRTGTRMRRRRTAATAVGGLAAGVVVVAIVGASLGGSGGTEGSEPGFASEPPSAALPSAAKPTRAPVQHQARTERLPVHVAPSLKGWKIGTAADEKFPASKGDSQLTVNVRPMSEYAAWSGNDPDHPASQVVHTGANYFVTVQPGDGVPEGVVAELVDALRYQPRWKH